MFVPLIVFVGAFLFDLYLQKVGGSNYHLLEIFCVLIVATRYQKEIGFNAPTWTDTFLGVFLGISFALFFSFYDPLSFSPQYKTIIWQFTVPAVAEEMVFRGVFLALLNAAFSKKWKIGNTRFGLGLILISILFAVLHLMVMPINTALYMAFPLLTISFTFGYLREKSDSLLPPILCHSLANGLYLLKY